MNLSPAQRKALIRAAKRERRNICPVVGAWAAAETALIDALDRKGLIEWDRPEGYWIGNSMHRGAPRIGANGFAAIDA